MTRSVWEFPCAVPRHAFSARDAARAGDIWRAFQEVAVEASTLAGWPPARYREVGSAFVVRSMTVRHHREPTYGEPLTARSWVRRFRRDLLSTREVRLLSARGPIAEGTQEWVHVREDLSLARAPAELLAAFPAHEEEEEVTLPDFERLEGPTHRFDFDVWFTWMDPLDHVNHPQYVDFCDEATSRALASVGVSPVALEAVAERVTFRAGLEAGQRATVESTALGRTADGDLVLGHRILCGESVCAEATTVRRLHGEGPGALVAAYLEGAS